jgi:hypothetical protein
MADPLRGPGAGPVDSVHQQRRSPGSDQGRVHVPCAAGQPHGRALLANVLGGRVAKPSTPLTGNFQPISELSLHSGAERPPSWHCLGPCHTDQYGSAEPSCRGWASSRGRTGRRRVGSHGPSVPARSHVSQAFGGSHIWDRVVKPPISQRLTQVVHPRLDRARQLAISDGSP